MKRIIFRVVQILLLIIMGLQVYTWDANLKNTGIAYNKYDTVIRIKQAQVKKSTDIVFVKKEASEAFRTIIDNEHKKHIGGNIVFLLLLVQIGFVFIIFVLSFFLK